MYDVVVKNFPIEDQSSEKTKLKMWPLGHLLRVTEKMQHPQKENMRNLCNIKEAENLRKELICFLNTVR
jgi:hypothetical protein